MNLDIKLLYLSLHNLLRKKYGTNQVIQRKEIYGELGRHFLIPKNLRCVVIKELENMNLIKKNDRDSLILLEYKFNIEEDTNRFLKEVGLF